MEMKQQRRRFSIDVKEQILSAVGGFGKWQMRKCVFIILIIWIPASFHLLNMVFFRAETDFWCSMPEELIESESWNEFEWRNVSNPNDDQNCFVYDVAYEKFINATLLKGKIFT